MEQNCIFCQLTRSPDALVYESATVAAFRDINPKAAIHLLVVPKRHVAMLDQLLDPGLGGQLLEAVVAVAAQCGIAGAYRVEINNGRAAGQEIDHLHLHVLADAPRDPGAHVA